MISPGFLMSFGGLPRLYETEHTQLADTGLYISHIISNSSF
jgi:hypothetical protein